LKVRYPGLLKVLCFTLALIVMFSAYRIYIDDTVQGQVRRLKLSDFVEGEPDPMNLALGSSTIRQMPDNVACGPWLNRGIGNAKSPDILAYISGLPKSKWQRILLYTGDNDIAFGASAEVAVERAVELIEALHERLQPDVLYLLPVKTAPARVKFADAYRSFNRQLADFASRDSRTISLLEGSEVLDPFDSELYKDDGIHLTETGYGKLLDRLQAVCR